MLFQKNTSKMLSVLAAAVVPGTAVAVSDVKTSHSFSAVSREVFGLHVFGFWVVTAICVVVFYLMIRSVLQHRKSGGHNGRHFHRTMKQEFIWTVLPILILLLFAMPAAYDLFVK